MAQVKDQGTFYPLDPRVIFQIYSCHILLLYLMVAAIGSGRLDPWNRKGMVSDLVSAPRSMNGCRDKSKTMTFNLRETAHVSYSLWCGAVS